MFSARVFCICALVGSTLAMQSSLRAAEDINAVTAFGKSLFFDPRLSADGNTACASCHHPDAVYADARATPLLRTDAKHATRAGSRNTPSLLLSTYYTRWSWDGRNTSLEAQVLEPLFSAAEHGFREARDVTTLIARTPTWASEYANAFGASSVFTIENIARALAQYVRSLAPAQARTGAGEAAKTLNDAESRGQTLFNGTASCASCHNPTTAFTDNAFHLRYQGEIVIDTAMQAAMNRVRLRTLSSKYHRATNEPLIASFGAFAATLDPKDLGTFRTPSLWFVARTAPYMHDGGVATLREAVTIEAQRRATAALSSDEIDALTAYLRTLTAP